MEKPALHTNGGSDLIHADWVAVSADENGVEESLTLDPLPPRRPKSGSFAKGKSGGGDKSTHWPKELGLWKGETQMELFIDIGERRGEVASGTLYLTNAFLYYSPSQVRGLLLL